MIVKTVREWKEEIGGAQFDFVTDAYVVRKNDGQMFFQGNYVSIKGNNFSLSQIISFDSDSIHIHLQRLYTSKTDTIAINDANILRVSG